MSNSQTPEPGTERILRSTTRNPRRRQRQNDNDNALPAQPPKRRRRNEIHEDTFQPRESTEHVHPLDIEDGHVADGETTTVANGHAQHLPRMGSGSYRNADTPLTMAFRGKAKRALRGDGATTLAHNKCYSVKLLPSTPKELCKEGLEYRGCLGDGSHALAVMRERAIVWDYTAHLTATNPRTFDIPFPARADEPVPFGALVANGVGSTDIGMVFISATTGKVVFHDSIDRAASLGIFQEHSTGVEGLIGSLFTGETVADLVPANHAGFVVVLSSGRIAQLTLRDAQGKPKIVSQFLRTTESNVGLLGSFGRLWSGGFRKDLAAVHTRALDTRGQVQVVALTERAEVLIWDIDWSGRAEFRAAIEVRDALVEELRALETSELAGKAENTSVLDFAILDRPTSSSGDEIATAGTDQPLTLLLLLRVGGLDMHTYALAEATVHGDNFGVPRIIRLSKYNSTSHTRNQRTPRIVVPKPGHTAFVAFEDATVLVGIQETESPEAQLHASFIQPDIYQEAIYLRPGKELGFQNLQEEVPRGSLANAVAFVKSAGLVRIAGVDVNGLPDGSKISAKSMMEQAVFYGSLQQDNIVDFSRKTDSVYSLDEVEDAALQLSQDIFRAETPFTNFISPTPTSMEQSLITKAKALGSLAAFVRQNYPAVSRSTMWRLLWDAERVAAGRQLWIAFEEHVALSLEKGKRKATILDEICNWFVDTKEEYTLREELYDEDAVRKFFIAGLHRLEKLLQFVKVLLADLKSEKGRTPEHILRFVYQANDVWLRALETTFAFRSENATGYGILPALVEDGILLDPAEFVDIPEFWTSTDGMVNNTVMVINFSRYYAVEYYDPESMPGAVEPARDIAMSNPKLVQLYCLQAQESINWRASRASEKEQELAQRLRIEFANKRYQLCRQLADVGQVEPGMKLAERYQDMHTLTEMVIAEEQYIVEEMSKAEDDEQREVILQHERELDAKIRRYFDKYGSKWSNRFFDMLFSGKDVGPRLEQAQKQWKKALVEYLRSSPSRAKICWINDITQQGDFAHASEMLALSAEQQESRLWAKKVELSLSKLALLAAQEGEGASGVPKKANNGVVKQNLPARELTIVNVQEKIYRHLRLELAGMIDREAEIHYCMENYTHHITDCPALRQLLENGLNLVLDHTALTIEQLIDVLTLMDNRDGDSSDNLQNSEFFHALVALDAAAPALPPERFEVLLRIIWKRCYIYDNWAKLAMFKKKSDGERKEGMRETATWQTLYHIVESGYLAPDRADRRVRILSPSECVSSACQPRDMAYRFPDEDLLIPILHDLTRQDEVLTQYVTDRRMDEIVEECFRDIRALVDGREEEARAALLRETRMDVEDRLHHSNGTDLALVANGFAKSPNGKAAANGVERPFEEQGFAVEYAE